MNTHTQEHRDYGFAIGLLMGTFVGAGLAMFLAPPSTSELRRRKTDSASSLGQRLSEQYQQGSTRVGEAVDELSPKGQNVRDEVADVVARGPQDVEHHPMAAKTDRIAESRKNRPADRSPSTLHSL